MFSLTNWLCRRPATWLGVAGGCLLGAAVPATHAATVKSTVTTTTNYYFISGTTAQAVHQSLQQMRPWRNQATYDAQTVWSLRHHYTFRQADGRFEATSFDLKTKINVTLPFWPMPKDVAPELRERWLAYLRALYTHEQGHLDFARQATAEFGQQLGSLGSFSSAQELHRAISEASTNVIARVRRLEGAYDAQTKHGATQGAVFWVGSRSPPASGPPTAAAPVR